MDDVPELLYVHCSHCAHGAMHPRDTSGWSFETKVTWTKGFPFPYIDWNCNGYCCTWPGPESEGCYWNA